MRLDFTQIDGGFILADVAFAPTSGWFEPDYWRTRGAGEPVGKGRGQVVSAGEGGRWVLRHYHRGGFPGRFIRDAYFWHGAQATRPVRELRVLSELFAHGAPVVRPVAARVLRAGLLYRGDILTERVSDARTLGACATELGPEDWKRIGKAIRRFHEAGGWHADLNAHNILVAPSDVFIIDLDHGRLVTPGAQSQRRNLERLERSLVKLGHLPATTPSWQVLLEAYHSRRPG
ncbi:MAG: 3-deoxy-D-manno-octulosonic acid kinase [Gammaproteobacteria bacterium]